MLWGQEINITIIQYLFLIKFSYLHYCRFMCVCVCVYIKHTNTHIYIFFLILLVSLYLFTYICFKYFDTTETSSSYVVFFFFFLISLDYMPSTGISKSSDRNIIFSPRCLFQISQTGYYIFLFKGPPGLILSFALFPN